MDGLMPRCQDDKRTSLSPHCNSLRILLQCGLARSDWFLWVGLMVYFAFNFIHWLSTTWAWLRRECKTRTSPTYVLESTRASLRQ